MTKKQRNQFDAASRVKQYGIDHPLTPANAAATAAHTALTGSIAQVLTLDSQRINGIGTSSGATQERQLMRKQLRDALSDLARVSKTLDKATYPDVTAQLKIGRRRNDQALLAFANNALEVVEPIKEVFIAHGATATFVEDIGALVDDFIAAGGRGSGGRGIRIGSNAGLPVAIRACMAQVRILDGIMSILLKPTPGLLAEWIAARRVRRGSVPEEETEQTTPPAPAP
jgi:hypothetical protein